ncbi:MAG: DUF2911 domain-containing protein [Gemmatimonadaceae bacterium]
MRPRHLLVSALLCCAALPSNAVAQIRASELGTMSQVIDGTRIAMQYYRPRARGRDTLFGVGDRGWGHLWTPGANWATTIEPGKSIKLNKISVPKGKYSMWMQLTSATAWTLVLDPDFHRFHEDRPDSNAKQIRIPVVVGAAPFTDVLTWSMPELRIDGGTLEFRWERARVALDVEVSPSLVMTISAADAAPYLGVYSYTELEDGKPGKVSTLTITHEDNMLRGVYEPEDPYFKKFALIRIAPDWFAPAVYDKSGKIYEVLRPDETWEFTRKAGKIMSFVVRLEDDELYARAVRKP